MMKKLLAFTCLTLSMGAGAASLHFVDMGGAAGIRIEGVDANHDPYSTPAPIIADSARAGNNQGCGLNGVGGCDLNAQYAGLGYYDPAEHPLAGDYYEILDSLGGSVTHTLEQVGAPFDRYDDQGIFMWVQPTVVWDFSRNSGALPGGTLLGQIVGDGTQQLVSSFTSGQYDPDFPDFPRITSLYVTVPEPSPAPPSAVPLPAAAWLFGSAILGFVAAARRKQLKA